MKYNSDSYDLKNKAFTETESEHGLYMFENELQTIYTKPQAPSWLTWEKTRTCFQAEQKAQVSRSAPRSLFPARKFSLALGLSLGLLLVLTAAVAAVSLSPLLQQVLGYTSPGNQLVQNQQFTLINKRMSVANGTITLSAAYADANEVILGVTTSNTSVIPTLQTEQGETLPALVENSAGPNNAAGASITYDASGIPGSSAQLHLKLIAPASGKAPAVIHFTVPSHGGQVLTPQTSATSDGVTVILKKVVIAPSSTLVTVQNLPGTSQRIVIYSEITLPGSTQTYDSTMGWKGVDGTQVIPFIHSLTNKPGTWTLKIVEQPRPNTNPPVGTKTYISFHLQVK